MKKKKETDLLRAKTDAMNRLSNRSAAAVDLVTRTINTMQEINKEIEEAVSEIDRYSADLMKTRQSMSDQKEHNEAIITNFSKLLEVA